MGFTVKRMIKFSNRGIHCKCGESAYDHAWYREDKVNMSYRGCPQFIPAQVNEAITTNAAGGKQSDVQYAFHLFDPKTVLAMAKCVKDGSAKYGEKNYLKIPLEEHINHSIGHQYKHLSGDRTETHLVNAAVRAMMALEMFLNDA